VVEVVVSVVDLAGAHTFGVVVVVAVAVGRMQQVKAQHHKEKTMGHSWKNVLKGFERATKLTRNWDLREFKKAQGERAG